MLSGCTAWSVRSLIQLLASLNRNDPHFGTANPHLPSDMDVRNNCLFQPFSWVLSSSAGSTLVKNGFEMKSARPVHFDCNTIENSGLTGSWGCATVLTVRSSQSGDRAIVSDITITNNVLKNVVSGFNSLARDDQCLSCADVDCSSLVSGPMGSRVAQIEYTDAVGSRDQREPGTV